MGAHVGRSGRRLSGALAVLFAAWSVQLGAPAQAVAAGAYVSDGSAGGGIWQFTPATNGSLTALSPGTVGDSNRMAPDLTVSPDGHSAYALENGPSGGGTGIYEFNVAANGGLTPKSTAMIAYGNAITTPSGGQAVITPDGSSLYVADFGGRIWQFSILQGGGLVAKNPANVPGSSVGTGELVVSPDGKSLYAAQDQAGGGSILQYDIGSTGLLTPKNPASVPLKSVARLRLSPDGLSLYATALDSNVYEFNVGTGGKLAPKSPASVSTAGAALGALAITPDGKNVYAGAQTNASGCNDGASEVIHLKVGAGGQLAPVDLVAGAPTNSAERDLGVSPDGKSLYAAESCLVGDSSGVRQWSIGAGGTLTPMATPFLATGPNAADIALTPIVTSAKLSVSLTGTGRGRVTGAGISCPGTCSHTYAHGTSVTLSARPASGSSFVGWSDACRGTGNCRVTLSASKSVTATFRRVPPNPQITMSSVDAAKRSAVFGFKAIGTATGF